MIDFDDASVEEGLGYDLFRPFESIIPDSIIFFDHFMRKMQRQQSSKMRLIFITISNKLATFPDC